MTDAMTRIADKVRGVAQEKRSTQEEIASLLGISRQSVSERYRGRVPFTGPELATLSSAWSVPIARLYPDEPQTTSAVRSVPDPGADGGGSSASASVTGADAEDISAA